MALPRLDLRDRDAENIGFADVAIMVFRDFFQEGQPGIALAESHRDLDQRQCEAVSRRQGYDLAYDIGVPFLLDA